MTAPTAAYSPPERLLRNRNFLLLWCAYFISAFGDHLSEMGLLEMQDAMHRTDSTQIQAIMLFAFMAPFFLLGPGMGWLADRLPRKWIMIFADLVRAALLFSLYPVMIWLIGTLDARGLHLSDRVHSTSNIPILDRWVYAMPLVLLGLFAAMFAPSRAAMLPTLVRHDQIIRANALTNALGPIATIVSYPLGAYIVSRFGVVENFHVDAATFIVSAALLFWIRPPPRPAGAARSKGALLAGFRYVRTHRRVLELILLAVVFWMAASTVRSVVPALVKDVFGGSIEDVGYYQATLGVGMVAGALLLSAFGEALRAEIAVSWSLIGAGAAVLWLCVVSAVRVFGNAGGFAGMFVCGFFGAGVLVGVNALIQRIVPDRYLGRVFGVSDFCSMAGLLLATGVLAIPDWPGIDRFVPWILAGVGLLLVASGIVAVRIRLRRGRFSPMLNFWINFNRIYCKAWLRARRIGPCTIPIDGPVIVAANHISSVDPQVILALSPNRYVSYMIAREYYNIPVVGRLVRMIQCVPVNRSGVDTASIKAALRHLEEGKVLGIFPQGGIRKPDDRAPPRDGVGMLALRSGATVIPACVCGIAHTDSVIRPIVTPAHARVRFGRPVDLTRWRGREKEREAYREVADAIMAAVWALESEMMHESSPSKGRCATAT